MKRLALVLAVLAIALMPAIAQEDDGILTPFRAMNDALFALEPSDLLNDPELRTALARLAGLNMLAVAETNLQIHSPPEIIDGHLVITGVRPRMGDTERASLWVRLFDGTPRLVLMTEGKVSVHADVEKFEFLPVRMRALVRDWHALGVEPPRDPPGGVIWRKSPEIEKTP